MAQGGFMRYIVHLLWNMQYKLYGNEGISILNEIEKRVRENKRLRRTPTVHPKSPHPMKAPFHVSYSRSPLIVSSDRNKVSTSENFFSNNFKKIFASLDSFPGFFFNNFFHASISDLIVINSSS